MRDEQQRANLMLSVEMHSLPSPDFYELMNVPVTDASSGHQHFFVFISLTFYINHQRNGVRDEKRNLLPRNAENINFGCRRGQN